MANYVLEMIVAWTACARELHSHADHVKVVMGMDVWSNLASVSLMVIALVMVTYDLENHVRWADDIKSKGKRNEGGHVDYGEGQQRQIKERKWKKENENKAWDDKSKEGKLGEGIWNVFDVREE